MSAATPDRVSDREVQARAKMAGFIDSVIDTIESTPANQETAKDGKKPTSRAERPATR